MKGITFNKDGATMDEIVSKDDINLIIKALRLKRFADIELSEEANGIQSAKTYMDDVVETKLIRLFEEIREHASEQDNRSIHIVVAEPVKYDYDDYL